MSNKEVVKSIISRTLGVESCLITDQLSAGDIAEWDSMGNMAIIAAIESELGIEFPIEDLFELNSVAALIEEIDKL